MPLVIMFDNYPSIFYYRLSNLVEPVLHTLQVTARYLGKSELGSIVEIMTAQLLSCDQDAITHITGMYCRETYI